MNHGIALLLAVASAAVSDPLPLESTSAGQAACLPVHLTVKTRVRARELAAALDEATRVLRPAMRVDWRGAGGDPLRVVDVHLVRCGEPHAPPCRKGVLGSTVLNPEVGKVRSVWIYVDRVRALAFPSRRERARLLGRVIAHELVHAVVGHNAHEPTGLMRAVWAPDVLYGEEDAEVSISPSMRGRIRFSLFSGGALAAARAP